MCRFERYRFEVMPFRLMKALSMFQWMMDGLLEKLPFVKVFLHDFVVFLANIHYHLEHFREVIFLQESQGKKMKVSISEIVKSSVSFLWYVVDQRGVRVVPRKVDAICGILRPSNQTELRSLLEIEGYYRRFIQCFASIATSLHTAMSSKAKFEWTKGGEEPFLILKQVMTAPSVLVF